MPGVGGAGASTRDRKCAAADVFFETGWLRGARRVQSPNHNSRPRDETIDLVVIHHISMPPGRFSGDAIERLFCNRLDEAAHPAYREVAGLRVSAHFLVRRRGELIQFVDCDRRAWHAGQSSFLGRDDCNDFSIGIELEGDGEHRFTQAQYRRLAWLIGQLRNRYPLRFVAAHSDIAPGRKHDPGKFFEWQRLMSSAQLAGIERPKFFA